MELSGMSKIQMFGKVVGAYAKNESSRARHLPSAPKESHFDWPRRFHEGRQGCGSDTDGNAFMSQAH
jgi:hypothetical protein